MHSDSLSWLYFALADLIQFLDYQVMLLNLLIQTACIPFQSFCNYIHLAFLTKGALTSLTLLGDHLGTILKFSLENQQIYLLPLV